MSQQVRVRFAPSPTGYLHVGGARTALFNWLYARKTGGKFILRIEDTDVERSTQEAVDGLLRDMKWLGLTWDEGPEVDGPHGPYFQSQRLEIYKKYAEKLLQNGSAYPCFCSEEELEAKRQKAEEEHRSLHYDGTCRNLGKEEVEKRIAAGEPYVVRVRVPDKDYVLNDLVRGRVEWKSETLGDFIILRSSGMPVYNFCVVVDDADMQISHVVRAEEHLTNTHRQLIIYEALGITPPTFAHASLILGEDKTKLSKRHGATSVGQYALDGFLPEAMINFLALLGWNEGNDREIYSVEELKECFTLERISKSPGVFDHAKLTWMNGQHLRALSVENLLPMVEPVLKKEMPDEPRLQNPEILRKLVELIQIKMNKLNDAVEVAKSFLNASQPENEEAAAMISTDKSKDLFAALAEEFASCEWVREGYNAAIKAAGKTAGAKGKELFMPIRVKITGTCHGPDLVGILDVLGREEVLKRLRN
ncbi:MAG: glutamyl-tRNA synthetase [Clostridiales bacterium]|jgi:glutamyl-tRNA synthetase|nr:glutamyl-tRNA synthetase [Clostridiales bacterium]MDN5281633.1 glutamyl-tRNA synthetase [Candidatus Ozemobacter sp.]